MGRDVERIRRKVRVAHFMTDTAELRALEKRVAKHGMSGRCRVAGSSTRFPLRHHNIHSVSIPRYRTCHFGVRRRPERIDRPMAKIAMDTIKVRPVQRLNTQLVRPAGKPTGG